MNRLDIIEKPQIKDSIPNFQSGDTIKVHVRIKEGNKERLQIFEGIVIARKHGGIRETRFVPVACAGLNWSTTRTEDTNANVLAHPLWDEYWASKETELEGPEPALRLALRSLNRQALNRWSLTQYLNLGSRGLRRAGRRGADRRRRRGRRDGQLGAPAADGARGAASRPLDRLERARRLLRAAARACLRRGPA